RLRAPGERRADALRSASAARLPRCARPRRAARRERMSGAWLRHPLLAPFAHGFGTRGCEAPEGLVRPKQVHGRAVLRAERGQVGLLGDADAIVCNLPGVPVGVVTADCLPVLIAAPSGAVAAAHAGWRGLAAGVLAAAVDALAAIAPDAERAVA